MSLRQAVTVIVAVGALTLSVSPVFAQGFGVGARLAWITPDTDADVDASRFIGGQLRLGSGRLGIEVSFDRHSESFEDVNQKVTETPLQVSVLLRSGGRFAPYLLGGPGWYRRTVETLDGPDDLDVSTTEFGWHGGIGLEIRPSRRFGIHGDYRYTFLDFDDDEDDDDGIIGGLLPGHRGSMWTLGATIYF